MNDQATETMTSSSEPRVTPALLSGDFIRVQYKQLRINPDLNVRKTYNADRVKALAGQIKADGMRRPPEVADNLHDSDQLYELLAGFTRMLALTLIYSKEEIGEQWLTVHVNRSKRKTTTADGSVVHAPLTSEEKLQINLASDETQEPVKRSELAERIHYLVVECGVRQEHVAKRCFVQPGLVSQLLRTYQKLHPKILEAWKKASTREGEIPLSKLESWSHHPHDEQLIAFHEYMAPPEELEASTGDGLENNSKEGEEGGGESPPARPAILHKGRSILQLRRMLERLKEAKESNGGVAWTEKQEGALLGIRWAMSDTKTLLGLSVEGPSKKRKSNGEG